MVVRVLRGAFDHSCTYYGFGGVLLRVVAWSGWNWAYQAGKENGTCFDMMIWKDCLGAAPIGMARREVCPEKGLISKYRFHPLAAKHQFESRSCCAPQCCEARTGLSRHAVRGQPMAARVAVVCSCV